MSVLDQFNLSGKTAIVTGGSQGLGEAFAHALAQAGSNVVVISRTFSKLKKVAEDLQESYGTETLPLEADITDHERIAKIVEKVTEEFGSIDILINNAATGRLHKPPEKTSLEEWKNVIETNVTGTFICSKNIGKKMIEQEGGNIVNIASMSGYIINKGVYGGPYDCSKSAIVGLTKVLAKEWAEYGIRVNAIAPGYFLTEPNEEFFSQESKLKDIAIDMTPLGRIGKPEELGAKAVFLSSKASSFMTGEIMFVDGGYTIM